MESDRQSTGLILAEAHRLGFDLAGVCDSAPPQTHGVFKEWLSAGMQGTMSYLDRSVELRSDPAHLLEGVRSIIAVGLNYRQTSSAVKGEPRIASYALGRDYHKTIRGKLRSLDHFVKELHPESSGRVCVDSAPILEREYAQRAGLGWPGKNTCLIDSKRGSWFLIGLLLTTAELVPSVPAVGGCGNCRLCIEACPTGAIVQRGEAWQVDSRKCVSYLTIEHKGPIPDDLVSGIGDWTFGCDVCQDVCPFNQPRENQPLRGRETLEPDFLARRRWPNLSEIATLQPADWDEITQGSPVRRCGLEGLQRNARINRENG